MFYGKSEEKIKKKIFNVLPETIFLKMFQLKQIIIKLFDQRHLSKMIDKCFTMVFAEFARKIYRQFWQGFLHKVHRKKALRGNDQR